MPWLRPLALLVLLAAASPALAQEVAGKLQFRHEWDLTPRWELHVEQQVQTDLVTPGEGGTFEGIDYVAFDDDDDDRGNDDDDGDDARSAAAQPSAVQTGAPGTPTTYLTDWASRTEVGVESRLSRSVRALAEAGLVLRSGGPVAAASVGLRTSHDLANDLEVGTKLSYETQRSGGDVDARLRLGAALGRDVGPLSPQIGVELFADPADRTFERVRIEVGTGLRVSDNHRVGAEVRFQRRIDRMDSWDSGLRLNYRIDL